jgi:glutaconate CoA-transferase, subunit A
MAERKVMSAAEAVRRFVADGDTCYLGYTSVAYAVCFELLRQRRRGLEVVGGSVGPQGTLLFLAGCADRVRTGYISGALRPGPVQELMADGRLRFEDYSNQAIALMLMAGALGIPYIPTRSFLGTDYITPENTPQPGGYLAQKWALAESPFGGEQVVLLPALRPDVAILPAQRADEQGNVQAWGIQGDHRWGYWAAKKVIVTVEEIVPSSVIRSDPGRTIVPGLRVAAVVHEPYAAHPTPMAGYYDFDLPFNARVLGRMGRSWDAFHAFVDEWVEGCPDRAAYLRHYAEVFGADALASIAADVAIVPERSVNYGYSSRIARPGG